MCGENLLTTFGSQDVQGSPPRVRGKHEKGKAETYDGRITPACAGKTFSSKKRA